MSDPQADLTERARAVVVAIKIESSNRPKDVREIMERRIIAALQSEREAAAAEARRAATVAEQIGAEIVSIMETHDQQ